MKRVFYVIALLVISLASQAQLLSKKKAVTANDITTWDLMEITSEIEYYISDPIVIQREVQKDPNVDYKALMESGKVNISGGKIYEIVQFTNAASGIFEYTKGDIIGIRFEHGEGRILEFQLTEMSGPENVQYYKLKVEKSGSNLSVNYAGANWQVMSGSYVMLEYRSDIDYSSKTQKTKVKGLNKDGSERKGILGK